jgi:[protein-PII] uridylyltransferase
MSAVPQPAQALARMRLKLGSSKNSLLETFAAARPSAQAATTLIRGLARLVDATLTELWIASLMPAGAALVAVGGYGRGELFPHSDVDVLVLLPDGQDTEAVRPAIERFITACWDIGLEIGSSVRTIDECAQEAARDVTVQTALLESRQVAGARRLFVALAPAPGLGHGTARVPARQDAGDAPAPHQVRGHALRAGAQLQGIPGGLRDLQVHAVGGARCRPGQQLGRTGPCQGPGYALRGAPDQAQRGRAQA